MLRGAALRAAWAAPMKLITQVIHNRDDCPFTRPCERFPSSHPPLRQWGRSLEFGHFEEQFPWVDPHPVHRPADYPLPRARERSTG